MSWLDYRPSEQSTQTLDAMKNPGYNLLLDKMRESDKEYALLQKQKAEDAQRMPTEGADLPWSGSSNYPKFGEINPFHYSPYPVTSEEVVEQGGEAAPPPDATPAQQIGVMNFNRSQGFGGSVGMPERPKMPGPREQSERIVQEEAKRVAFDQSKIPNWYESSSFYTGMLAMGLSLMSDSDLATAFQAGSQAFQENYGMEKRSAWANDLAAMGYDDHEIQAWIQSGDNKMLTSPEEKKRRARRDAMEEAQLRLAEYQSSPEYLQYRDDIERYKLGQEDAQQRFSNQMQLANYNLAVQNAQRMGGNADLDRQLKQLQIQKAQKELETVGSGKYNESLSKATNQYIRGRQGLKNYQETEARLAPKYDEQGPLGNFLDAGTIDAVFSGNAKAEMMARSVNPTGAEMITAEREFLAPLLRKDSGAAISASEWRTTGEVYFPRPGDSPERRAQKQQAREVAVLAMNPSASPQLKQAMDLYTTGALQGLRVVGHKVYANDGNGWIEIQQ